jgi:hypothetical protein
MSSFNMGLGRSTYKAMAAYHAHRNKAMKPKLQAPKIPNAPARVNRVTAGMQATANQRFNQLNFSS